MKISFVVLLIATFSLSGCFTQQSYTNTGIGEFEGVVQVRWVEPDLFLFVPKDDDPLRFKTADGTRTIEPEPMYTDGGSIPRIFWSIPGYSPWGLAPAYIIHDWLFEAHRCGNPEYADITFKDSSRYMAESIKTLMETDKVPKDEALFSNVVSAVETPIAEKLWDRGTCDLPPQQLAYGTVGDARSLSEKEAEQIREKLSTLRESVHKTSELQEKQDLELESQRLEKKLQRSLKLSQQTAMRREYEQATKLLFEIDMNQAAE